MERLLDIAGELATKLDPAETPSAQEVVDFMCLLTRSLGADVDRAILEAAGIRVQVEPYRVRVSLPVALELDRECFLDAWLEIEYRPHRGVTGFAVQRVLTPAGRDDCADRPEFSAAIPVTSAVDVVFEESRGREWLWAIQDGWFHEPSLSNLRYVYRDQPILDSADVDRACLTAEALLAWAASLPWLGPEPPLLDPGSPLSHLYAAAEGLAVELEPGRAPAPSRVVDFVCLAATTLGSDPDAGRLTDARIQVQRSGRDGVQLCMPVRAGVTSPDFRAGFLVLELEDLDDEGAEILIWRELVPSLAGHPVQPTEDDENPRFSGIQPASSWLEIDLAEGRMTAGDVRLESREADDWSREPREGFEDVPVLVGGWCLEPETLRAFAAGLQGATRPAGGPWRER